MIDHQTYLNSQGIDKLTPDAKKFLNETRSKLKGSERRKFMAKAVLLMGKGGQRRAEHELGWDRKTIIKGTRELETGIDCLDNFSRSSSFYPQIRSIYTRAKPATAFLDIDLSQGR